MITFTIPPAPPELPTIVFVVPAPAAIGFCFDRLADSIRTVEDSGERARGRAGEWGYWQIMPAIWRRYSQRIQWNAPETEQRRVALAHLRALADKLAQAGIQLTPYTLALAWNAGEGRTILGRAPNMARDYADRARNIYESQS